MRVRAEAYSNHAAPPTGFAPFVVGRLVDARDGGLWSKGDRVLVSVSDPKAEEVEASSSACVRVPDGLDPADALLIPSTAQALRVWRLLALEIGEAAVYTDGIRLAGFVGFVAIWRGGLPVIRLTTGGPIPDVETVSITDAASAVERVRSLTANAPGLAGRRSLRQRRRDCDAAGSAAAMGQTDARGALSRAVHHGVLHDIHRKGVVVCSAGDLDSIFAEPLQWQADIRNACRLLLDAKRAAILRDCLGREPDACRQRS
jgi:hypothetical protein